MVCKDHQDSRGSLAQRVPLEHLALMECPARKENQVLLDWLVNEGSMDLRDSQVRRATEVYQEQMDPRDSKDPEDHQVH